MTLLHTYLDTLIDVRRVGEISFDARCDVLKIRESDKRPRIVRGIPLSIVLG